MTSNAGYLILINIIQGKVLLSPELYYVIMVYYNCFLIRSSAPFSSRDTCACEIPISSAISI